MAKSITELLGGKKSKYGIVDEDGKLLKEFRLKATATTWIPKMKKFKQEKLAIIEIKIK